MTTPQDPENPPPGSWADPSPEPALTRPRELTLSFWLWMTAAGLLLASALFLLTQRDALVESARQASTDRDFTEEQLQAGATGLLMIVLIGALIVGGLIVFFAVKSRTGRSWTRVALTVMTPVVFLYSMFLAMPEFSLVIALVVAGAVVTLYLPGSKAYFDAVKKAG
ncbi:hypothetical protein F4560_006103 [Saccharothrix ecbatanensis]|uniref:Uncharacterized protein n=1 Tax=Saccharothrix ecbatanensis TaxID=1105145 RepID=A0A7W9M3R7_9PSEU|nr:hypothetical protein [Saccharothrix ecbatanensis]MBB5806335.1 hypothetical protein [Saccharothrix ecbatanensis]